MSTIDKVELTYLQLEDHKDIVDLMNDEYKHLDDSSWTYEEFSTLLG